MAAQRPDLPRWSLARPTEDGVFEGLLQPTHLLIIMAIALVVFGPGKLGDIGGQLGRGVKDFKKAVTETDDDQPTVAEADSALTVDAAVAPKAGAGPA